MSANEKATAAAETLRWSLMPLQRTLGEHAADWAALNRRSFGDHPLLSAEFVDALLRCFGVGKEHLCVGRDAAQQIQAMCLLQPEAPMVWRSFLPSQAQVGPTLVRDATQARHLCRALPSLVQQLDLLCCDPDFTTATSLHAPAAYPLPHALTISVPLAGRFEEYFQSLTPKLRSNIKRYFKKLAEDGRPPRLLVRSTRGEVEEAVTRYAVLEASGWKGQQGTALGSSDHQQRFYAELLCAAAAEGRARIYELYFGDKLVASRLGYQRGGMLVMLKTTYDETEAKLAPGRVLLHDVLKREFERKEFHSVEFYTDANADLMAWSTRQRWIYHLSLYRHSQMAPLADSARALLRRNSPAEASEPGDKLLTTAFFAQCSELPKAALELMRQSTIQGSYLGPDWYANLERTVYNSPQQVEYAVLNQDGHVLCVLPMLLQWRAGSLCIQGLSSFYTPLYAPAMAPLLKPHSLAVLLHALRARHTRLRSLDFSPMDNTSHAGRTLLAALRMAGFPSFEYFCFDNWHVGPIQGWQDYIEKRSGQLRSTLARKGRRFASASGQYQLITRPEELEAGLAAYAEVYSRSWKKPEPFPEFVPGLMRTYAARGELRLGLAYLQNRPVAAQVWIVSQGRAEIHKLAYDTEYKSLSPGTLLSEYLMHHVLEQDKVTEIDYLIGADPYKQLWMDQRRERWGIVAYNTRTLSGMFGLGTELVGRLTKGMRRQLRGLLAQRSEAPGSLAR